MMFACVALQVWEPSSPIDSKGSSIEDPRFSDALLDWKFPSRNLRF